MNRFINLNFFVVSCGLIAIEFIVIPYTLFFIYPLLNSSSYLSIWLLMSGSRICFAFLFALLVNRFASNVPRVAIYAAYFLILCGKFLTSEMYIQSGNLYALATAVTPYFLGFFALVIGSFKMQNRVTH